MSKGQCHWYYISLISQDVIRNNDDTIKSITKNGLRYEYKTIMKIFNGYASVLSAIFGLVHDQR